MEYSEEMMKYFVKHEEEHTRLKMENEALTQRVESLERRIEQITGYILSQKEHTR